MMISMDSQAKRLANNCSLAASLAIKNVDMMAEVLRQELWSDAEKQPARDALERIRGHLSDVMLELDAERLAR